jgi:hypothetical protein
MRSGQKGVSLIGLLFVGGVLAFSGVMLAQALPTYFEFQAVLKAVEKVKDAGTVVEIRNSFDKAATVDDIKSIGGKDLDIGKENDRVVVKFAYDKEIHIAGPAYLLLKYAGQSK